ncbi:MAG: NADH-quinone oxidoreductase subunit L [Bacteroidota bacterium]
MPPPLPNTDPGLPTAYANALWLLLLLLVYFLVQAFIGKKLGKKGAWIAVAVSGVSFGLALTGYLGFLESLSWDNWITRISLPWISIDTLTVNASVAVDHFSAPLLVLITGITFLVHIFSVSYMEKDQYNHRYWAFLALFSFAMCGLVLAENLLFMFVFWELVGLASYFLIGFWFKKDVSARASQKAFIVNRIGDAGFLIAIIILWGIFGSLSPQDLYGQNMGYWGVIACFGLIIAAFGKSAQFPLQIWLPDAMAGPTPVSSLIHAATMVAAGIYLLLRTFYFFPPEVLQILAYGGAFTALIAAISALSQTDIKRVLAYSTISQLGFMVLGVGTGNFQYALLHLFTHAFFKCGLFLVAGAVIHNLHHAQHATGARFDVQDLRWMGGLRKRMPLAMACYIIFGAALAGLPLFSGFLSKDGLLLGAWSMAEAQGGMTWLLPIMGITASALTAFYIARHGILIFGGQNRAAQQEGGSDLLSKVPRTPLLMLIPLAVLALFSLWVLWSPDDPLHAHSFWGVLDIPAPAGPTWMPWLLTGIAVGAMLLAAWRYRRGPSLGAQYGFFYGLSFQHFYIDRMYTAVIAQPLLMFTKLMAAFDRLVVDGLVNAVAAFVIRKDEAASLSRGSTWVETNIIDRMVNGVAGLAMRIGGAFRNLQAGQLQRYLIYTLILLFLLFALIYFVAA